MDTRHCVVFGHSRCQETMEAYRDKVTAALGIRDCAWDELGAVIGTHAGPGAFGLAFFDKGLLLGKLISDAVL